MYLLSSDIDIFNNITDVFNFEERLISPYDYAAKPWQTGSSIRTVKLAYNLFNGCTINGHDKDSPYYTESSSSVSDIFDYGNLDIYLTALKIRYGGLEL